MSLTYIQLMSMGAHMGHSFLDSEFFSSWMLHGWRTNVFIFNTIYSVYLISVGMMFVKKCVSFSRPIWFVNFNYKLSPVMSSYAYVCGESFSMYSWMNGALTNFRSMVGWGALLHDLAAKGMYDFSHSDRKSLSSLIGFLFYSKRLPGTLILPSVKDCEMVSDEFLAASIPTVGIVDSNALSWAVTIPMPGNDDSFQCMNFYCFIFSKLIMSNKVFFLMQWYYDLSKKKKTKLKRKLYYYYLFNKYNVNLSINTFDDDLSMLTEVFKNKNIFYSRSLSEYELLMSSFVKSDVMFSWKNM